MSVPTTIKQLNEVVVKLREDINSRLVAVESSKSKSYDGDFLQLNERLDTISTKVDDGNNSIKQQLEVSIRAIKETVMNNLIKDNQNLRTRVRTLEQRIAIFSLIGFLN